jgi:hypothetical protein
LNQQIEQPLQFVVAGSDIFEALIKSGPIGFYTRIDNFERIRLREEIEEFSRGRTRRSICGLQPLYNIARQTIGVRLVGIRPKLKLIIRSGRLRSPRNSRNISKYSRR